MPRSRALLPALTLAVALLLSACTSSADIEDAARTSSVPSSGAAAVQVDTTPQQAHRAHTTADPGAAALLPRGVVADGKLTVGVVGNGEPPLAFLADDNTTVVGSEVDVASLVAESLGLRLDLRNIS